MKNGQQTSVVHSFVISPSGTLHTTAPIVAGKQNQTLEPRGAVAKTDASGHKILIVEDDQVIAEMLSICLQRQGYKTLVANTGLKSLELARQHRPDLVLLDVNLPDADGFKVCRELDETPATGDIPVIMLSGLDSPDIIRRARAVGCRYYLHKPYDPNALLVLIQQAIREREEFEVF